MYSERLENVRRFIEEQNEYFASIIKKSKIKIVLYPPASGAEDFKNSLPQELIKKVEFMRIFSFDKVGDILNRNMEILDLKNIINFGDFGIKRIPEEFFEEINKIKNSRAIIFAYSARKLEERGIQTEGIKFRWMGIDYIPPSLLSLSQEEIENKNIYFLNILHNLNLDSESLGLHSADFMISLRYLDDRSISDVMEKVGSVPLIGFKGKYCVSLISSILLVLFHGYGMDYSKKFREILYNWVNMHPAHKELLSSQFSLELSIPINDVKDCLDSINEDITTVLIERLDPYLKDIENKIKNSIRKVDCDSLKIILNMDEIPLPGEGDEDFDNSIRSAVKKLEEYVSRGTVIIVGRDRHEKASLGLPLLKNLCPRGLFVQGEYRLEGMKWVKDSGIIMVNNYENMKGYEGVVAFNDNMPEGEKINLEDLDPVKIFTSPYYENIYFVSINPENIINKIVRRYLEHLIPGEYTEDVIDKIVSISGPSLSRAYINSLAFSLCIKEGMNGEDAFLIVSSNPSEAYSILMDKLNTEQILCLYESTYHPVDRILIESFKLDMVAFERHGDKFRVPVEISESVREIILKNGRLLEEIDKNMVNIVNEIKSAGVKEEIVENLKMIPPRGKMDICFWHSALKNAESNRGILHFLLYDYLERIESRNNIALFTVYLLHQRKNIKGLRYTPIYVAIDSKNPLLLPYLSLEYGAKSIEFKIVSEFFKALYNMDLIDKNYGILIDYYSGDYLYPMEEKSWIYHYLMGSHHMEKGEFDTAMDEFNKSVSKNQLLSEPFLMIAYILYRMEERINSISKKMELLENAKRNIENSISINNRNYIAYLLKGYVDLKEGRIERDTIRKIAHINSAKNDFEKGKSTGNDFSPLYSGAGDCLFDLGMLEKDGDKKKNHYQMSLNEYRIALEKDPGNVRALIGYANCIYEISKFEKSIKERIGMLRDAMKYYDDSISIFDTPEAHNGKGNILLALSRFERDAKNREILISESQREYEKSISMDMNLTGNYLGLGNSMLELSRIKDDKIDLLKKAKNYFDQGLNIDFLNPWIHYGKGEVFLEMARIERNPDKKSDLIRDAMKEYEQAIKIDPYFVHAYNGIGNALLELNKIEKNRERWEENIRNSLKNFEKAISIDNSYTQAYNGRSICYAIMAREERKRDLKRDLLQKSIKDLDYSISISPFYAQAYHNYGNRLIELSELESDRERKIEIIEEAIKRYEEALTLDPTLKQSYNGMGNAYLLLSKMDRKREKEYIQKAMESYENALMIDKNYENARKNLELCRSLLKR
ncbi:MAG: hypothetical protein F9Y92_05315 [Thermoplasmatales archaeon]|nr:hypothetical protein [Thermoplasmatales archaeon]